jgi:hypothetical protein
MGVWGEPVRPGFHGPPYRSGNVLNVLFGLDQDSSELTPVPGGSDGQYYFVYYGIPGQPNGYIQHSYSK